MSNERILIATQGVGEFLAGETVTGLTKKREEQFIKEGVLVVKEIDVDPDTDPDEDDDTGEGDGTDKETPPAPKSTDKETPPAPKSATKPAAKNT